MNIKLAELDPRQIYHLMIQTIIPRPIAWILTKSRNESLNLAPFSYFNGVSSDPPIMMVSIGKKKNGDKKDSWVNIEERKEFVIHIASDDLAEKVNETSFEFDYGKSEIEESKLNTIEVEGWSLPRLENAKVAMLCSLYQIHEIGNKPQGMILGEIKDLWLDASVVKKKHDHYWLDPEKINPLARLGSNQFGSVTPYTKTS